VSILRHAVRTKARSHSNSQAAVEFRDLCHGRSKALCFQERVRFPLKARKGGNTRRTASASQ
jgi:hypothetical protein